jgi:hypothetical protein
MIPYFLKNSFQQLPKDFPMNLQERFTKYLTKEGFVYSDLVLQSVGDYEPRDAEWNYSDVPHLNYIHSKANAEPFVLEDEFASSLYLQDFLFLKKIPVLVNNFHSEVDHHTYCSQFFIFFVIIETRYFKENNKTRVVTTYRIFSKPLFKFLHYFVKVVLNKNYQILMSEDTPMRDERAELRAKGYTFKTDTDRLIGYKQTVDITIDNLIPPPEIKTGQSYTFKINELEQSESTRVSNGINELLLSVNQNNIVVFPGYCPHEGARLEIRGKTVTCPWHGRACKPLLTLKKENKSEQSFHQEQFDLTLEDNELTLTL